MFTFEFLGFCITILLSVPFHFHLSFYIISHLSSWNGLLTYSILPGGDWCPE